MYGSLNYMFMKARERFVRPTVRVIRIIQITIRRGTFCARAPPNRPRVSTRLGTRTIVKIEQLPLTREMLAKPLGLLQMLVERGALIANSHKTCLKSPTADPLPPKEDGVIRLKHAEKKS